MQNRQGKELSSNTFTTILTKQASNFIEESAVSKNSKIKQLDPCALISKKLSSAQIQTRGC